MKKLSTLTTSILAMVLINLLAFSVLGSRIRPCLAAASVNAVADGGFELGTPNAAWSEGSTNFGTPICSTTSCGTGGGTAGPHAGDYWVWFGGINDVEIGFVSQDVTISAETTTLSFWLWIGRASGTGVDLMQVSIDGDEVFKVTDADQPTYATYTQVVLDVSAYADGGTHTLSFDSLVFGGGITNINVDDVAISEIAPAPPQLVYLPLVMKNVGPLSSAPVLNDISNPDGDGSYTVSWSVVGGATAYTLEEDDNPAFSSPDVVYSGPYTSTSITGKDVGTYYYRVMASNTFGSSDWSNVESVVVTVPLPSCSPTPGNWSGTGSGLVGSVSFVVSSDSSKVTRFGMSWIYPGACGHASFMYFLAQSITTDCHFSGSMTSGSATYRWTGDFSTASTATGTWSVRDGTCSVSGTWKANGPASTSTNTPAPPFIDHARDGAFDGATWRE